MRRLAPFREREAHKREGSERSWDFFAGEKRRRPTTKSFSQLLTMAHAAWNKRWIKPEIFPLFAAMGAALGICGFAIARNIAINPDVRISKEDRAAGILENYNEGKSYKDHSLREYVKDCKPEIMPGLNRFFSASK